jgi:CRP-like cAMP-binding protein
MPQDKNANQLLCAIADSDYAQLRPHLEPVSFMLGQKLHDSGERLQCAYFPTTAIISLNNIAGSGSSTEIAGVGREGLVGFALYMGGETSLNSAVVQTAGMAFRLDHGILMREFARAGTFQRILLRYVHSLMMQIGQTAVCNRHHSIDQQLCRLLLQTLDRMSGQELVMTQELISNLLGVRREAIAKAAFKLKSAGCISYRRGHISIIDRFALEKRVCECYDVVKIEMLRLSTLNARPLNSLGIA